MYDTPPRHLTLPPVERTLLDWFADDYDHVFIAFHPFFRVPGYSPATAAFGPIHADLREVVEYAGLTDAVMARPNEAPEGFEDEIKQSGEPVRWDEVQRLVGASDFNLFARTAWLWTIGADRPDQDGPITNALDRLVARGLYKPEEDTMPVVMEPMIHRYLTAIGAEEVTIWSELRDAQETIHAEAFAAENPPVRLPEAHVSAISCDSPRMLIAWNFDGVEAFVCIPDEVRRLAAPERFFEGRYAGTDTYVDWLNPTDLFKRKLSRPS